MNDLLQQISALWSQILENPWASLAIVGNLIIIESLLSVDNAAVLATMVMDLEPQQRNKALRYGIWGAYIFRGLAMIFAAFLIKIWWLKPLGGLYLLYLVWDWWKGKQTEEKDDDFI
jgi:predicted tellurium resistance membrane protein TerC